MNEQAKAYALYKRRLKLYPRVFRERLGESMEQTLSDLYNERRTEYGLLCFVFWMFTETSIGMIKEHTLIIK